MMPRSVAVVRIGVSCYGKDVVVEIIVVGSAAHVCFYTF